MRWTPRRAARAVVRSRARRVSIRESCVRDWATATVREGILGLRLGFLVLRLLLGRGEVKEVRRRIGLDNDEMSFAGNLGSLESLAVIYPWTLY